LLQPCLSVEASGIDHQGVTIPFPGGISQACGSEVLCQFTAIKKDLPPEIESFVDNHDKFRLLDDFPRRGSCADPGHTLRKALGGLILSRMRTVFALIEQRFGPWLVWDVVRLQVRREVLDVPAAVRLPDSRQVRAAIRQPRRRR